MYVLEEMASCRCGHKSLYIASDTKNLLCIGNRNNRKVDAQIFLDILDDLLPLRSVTGISLSLKHFVHLRIRVKSHVVFRNMLAVKRTVNFILRLL